MSSGVGAIHHAGRMMMLRVMQPAARPPAILTVQPYICYAGCLMMPCVMQVAVTPHAVRMVQPYITMQVVWCITPRSTVWRLGARIAAERMKASDATMGKC
eukprot:1153194-Pelagomonas_calceolata.AAC.2